MSTKTSSSTELWVCPRYKACKYRNDVVMWNCHCSAHPHNSGCTAGCEGDDLDPDTIQDPISGSICRRATKRDILELIL